MPFPLALILLAPPGPAIFNQSIAAFRARRAFSVGIALAVTMNRNTENSRYHLTYQAPDRVLLSRLAGNRPSVVFWLNGTRFIAFDPIANEMTDRKTKGGDVVDRLVDAMGGIEDPVKAQLSPTYMASFLGRLRAVPNWSASSAGGLITMIHTGTLRGRKTRAELDFSASSKLLTRAVLEGPGSRLLWQFGYGIAPRELTFRLPPGTKKVSALIEHIAINASDDGTRSLVDQSLRAYARISTIAYSVTGPDGPIDNWMDGASFCEKGPKLQWAYRAGILTIRDMVSGRAYLGKCKHGAVLNYLKILHAPADPVLIDLFSHRNPIRGWFLPEMTVSGRGTVTLGGVVSGAVEAHSKILDLSILVRSDNHLVASVSSRTKDESGRTIFEADRTFRYWSVNQPIRASSFEVTAGRFLPLSQIGRR